MTIYTFPLAVAVPPRAVFGVGPTFNDDSLGTDATPVGWPENGRARSVSVTISAVDENATGDVIVGINQERVSSVNDVVTKVKRASDNKQKAVLLLIDRKGNERFIPVPLSNT